MAAAPPPPTDDLDGVILKRGSTRRMDASATVSKPRFERRCEYALSAAREPHFIAVHGVEDVEPGLYRWPDLAHPLRTGDLREELLRLCWDQDLGRDAAFVVMGATDLTALDDRGYRDAQLDAGLVEGRLHLAAYALGFGASGMTFLDTEFEATIGEPLAAMLFTCVGVPTLPRHGGRPAGRAGLGGRPGRRAHAPAGVAATENRPGLRPARHTGRPAFGANVHNPVDMAHAHPSPVDPVGIDHRCGGLVRPLLLARRVRGAAGDARAGRPVRLAPAA